VLLGQATATPKRASVLLTYTRQLNVQSDVGAFVQSNGLKALGAAVDRACLVGSGIAGEPLGLLNMPGTSAVTFSTTATWANALSFVYNCETANVATGDISFIAGPECETKMDGDPTVHRLERCDLVNRRRYNRRPPGACDNEHVGRGNRGGRI
jgi:Phage capsid family